jgi:undecaprenyl-diphosphatase
LILGIVQGVTEFVPISSSGHLVLVPWLLEWPNPGVAFDAMLHLGTLLAVFALFWRDLAQLTVGGILSIKERSLGGEPRRRMAWLIALGTIPAMVLGVAFEDFFEGLFGAPMWVGVLLLVTGALLMVSEKWSRQRLEVHEMTWFDGLMVGLGQALAIAPGISRSGATISSGLWRGLQREAAARYSFLLAVPIIFGAGLFKLKDLWEAPLSSSSPLPLLVGFLAAAISGFLSIKFLLAYLRQRSLYPFAAYCWAVGTAALLVGLLSLRW